MIGNRLLGSLASLLVYVVAAEAQPDPYCQSLAPLMNSKTLYVVTCAHGSGCIQPVVYSGESAFVQGTDGALHRLNPGQSYRFLYKTFEGNTTVNSLVAIHIKRLDVLPRGVSTPSPVRLRRYALDFACVGFKKNVTLPAWPGEDVQGRNLPSVPYDKYDQFHRFGYTSPDESALLKQFHVSYYNGQQCVSTTDPVRRAQFLFTDRGSYHGPWVSLATRFGIYTPEANAQDIASIARYESLKVLVSNYRGSANTSGCFSFTTRAGAARSAKLDVTISDIEQQVRSAPFDTSESWSFQLR
jgi:hypothetical protein